MSVTNKDVIDSVAYEDDELLLQIYDHLDFTKQTIVNCKL